MGDSVNDEDLIALGLPPRGDSGMAPTVDTFRSELDTLVNDPAYLDKPHEEQLTELRKLYSGPELDGSRNWSDEEKVREVYRDAASALRDYNDILVNPDDYIGPKVSLPPNPLEAQNGEEYSAMLDMWEAEATNKLKTDYGLDYLEYGDIAEQQIRDIVDEAKKRANAAEKFQEPADTSTLAGRLALVAQSGKTAVKAGLEPMAELAGWLADSVGLAPEGTGERMRRAIATSKLLTEPPEIQNNEVGYTIPGIGFVPLSGLARGVGTTAGIILPALATGGAAAALAPAAVARGAATVGAMSAAGRMGYREGYDSVFRKTQNREKAVKSAWLNAGVEAMDGAFDMAIAHGLIPAIGKGVGAVVSKSTKATILTNLVMKGQFGNVFKKGLSLGAAGLAGGTSEVAQEYVQGVGTAEITGDESFGPTKEGSATAGIVGGVTGTALGVAGESSSNSPPIENILQRAGLGLNNISQTNIAPEEESTAPAEKTQTATAETKLPDVPEGASLEEIDAAITKTAKEDTGSEKIPEDAAPAEPGEQIAKAVRGEIDKGEDVTILGKPYSFERQTINPNELVSQKDIPNVKLGADPETGVVGDPENFGRFSQAKSGNIVVLEKDVTAGGEKEVVSGRNRWYAAKKQGIKGISSLVIKESDGFTIYDAHALDAELNIADNQGETIDYATFFKENPISYEKAREHGILRNKKGPGMRGFVIGSQSTPALFGLYKNRRISEEYAVAIAGAAPNNVALQEEGITLATRKENPMSPDLIARNLAAYAAGVEIPTEGKVGDRIGGEGPTTGNGYTFADLGEASAQLQAEAEDEKARLTKADKVGGETILGTEFPELPPEQVKQRLTELRDRIARLDPLRFAVNPEIMQEVRTRAQEIAGKRNAEERKGGQQIGLSFLEGGTMPPPVARQAAPVQAEPPRPAETIDSPSLFSVPTTEKPGISAARGEEFKTSKTFEKAEAAQLAAQEAGTEGPFSSDVATELFARSSAEEEGGEGLPPDFGQYLSTTEREQSFFADRFIEQNGKDNLINQILDPEQVSPLAELPIQTRGTVLAKLLDSLKTDEAAARAQGDTEKANELKHKQLDFWIELQHTAATPIGQALAMMKNVHKILGTASGDSVTASIEDILSFGKETDPTILKDTAAVFQEQEDIGRAETNIQDQAVAIQAAQGETKRLEGKIKERAAQVAEQERELGTIQKELSDERQTLNDELKELEKEEKRLDKKYNQLVARQEAKVRELEARALEAEGKVEAARQALSRAQEDFAATRDKIKKDISDLRRLERQLKARKRLLVKKELDLRKRRAKNRERFTMESLPAQTQGKVKKLIERLETAPEGSFVRQEIAAEIYNEALKHSKMSPIEMGLAAWYANALSGFSTQGINIWGNGLASLFRSVGFLAINPTVAGPYLRALMKSFLPGSRARAEAGSIIEGRGGRVSVDNKFNVPRGLEILQPDSTFEAIMRGEFAEAAQTIKDHPLREAILAFGIPKFVSRLLRAEDAFFYRTAYDAMVAAQLAIEGKKAGITKEEIATNIAHALYGTDTQVPAAIEQAEQVLKDAFGEGGYSQRDITRATFEILNENIPPAISTEADRWGSFATFTQPLEGIFGVVAHGINAGLAKATIPTRFGKIPLGQPFFPFVNVIANVAETGVEFSPIGFAKAYKTQNEARQIEVATNAIIGSAMGAIILGVANHFSDDDDPAFMIYGSGDPLTKERKDQMKQGGWRPFTVKVGSLYIPYKETPLYWLAAFGAYFDNRRWNSKFDSKVGTNYVKFFVGGIGEAFTDIATLGGIAGLYDVLTGDKDPVDFVASYSSNFLPASSLARDMDRIFNAQFQETIPSDKNVEGFGNVGTKFAGAMFKNYPVIGELLNRPMLNGFGEPLEPVLEERFGLLRRSIGTFRRDDIDPEWKFLSEHGLTFNGFKKDIEIGKGGNSDIGQARVTNFKKKRADLISRAYVDVFTPEERYDFVKAAGPKIKTAINKVMNRAGNKDRGILQGEIDEAVSEAKEKAKIDFISRRLNQMRSQ